MKKTIKMKLLDYGKEEYDYYGSFEKKVYCKNFSKKTIKNLEKYDWFYSSNYIDSDNYLVLEFKRYENFKKTEIEDINLFTEEIKDISSNSRKFIELNKTNSNIFW
jgi:hypothetical protein